MKNLQIRECMMLKVVSTPPNKSVQATPDSALLFIVDQISGAPDAER